MDSNRAHAGTPRRWPPPDAPADSERVAIHYGMTAVRSLRAALLELVYAAIEHPPATKFLVLVDPGLGAERLAAEWRAASLALRPDALRRVQLITVQDGLYSGFPEDPGPTLRRLLERAVGEDARHASTPVRRTDHFFVILKLLLHRWLKDSGPMTTGWLTEAAGCSYPTVASALKRLGSSIARHADRRVELCRFPREEWNGLVARSEELRSTARFADTSAKAATPTALLKRFRGLHPPDAAVGGTFGAVHHHRALGLRGDTRLDLSLHSVSGVLDLGLVERLDPRLKRVEDPRVPANLVLHSVRHRESLFESGRGGHLWADPVECLLDLHEARLERPMLALLRVLLSRRAKAR